MSVERSDGEDEPEIDDLSDEALEKLHADSVRVLEDLMARWKGLRRLPDAERATSLGKQLPRLERQLRLLFTRLVAEDGTPSPLAAYFDALGASDRGKDPDRFEADLLLRRMRRAKLEQDIRKRLDAMSRHFADDVLWTGAAVVEPGKKALDLGRTLVNVSDQLRTFLAPVSDALGEMTKGARLAEKKRQASDRAGAVRGPESPGADPGASGRRRAKK